jgi:2-haloalkanoic acid dehalogenase type II
MSGQFDAVLFDLLSALIDSWSLWDDVAGDSALGRQWRLHYLEAASHTKRYEPYIALIGKSAEAAGLSKSRADILASRWCELAPWPEATQTVAELASRTKIGVITNCSEDLGVAATKKIGVSFDVVLTSERAGYYKPDSRIYEMAISEIGEAAERILYVAGSPYDVCGAAAAGMPVFWHNRTGLIDTEASAKVTSEAGTLFSMRGLVG